MKPEGECHSTPHGLLEVHLVTAGDTSVVGWSQCVLVAFGSCKTLKVRGGRLQGVVHCTWGLSLTVTLTGEWGQQLLAELEYPVAPGPG